MLSLRCRRIWFLPYPLSRKLDRRPTFRRRKRDKLLTGEGGERVGGQPNHTAATKPGPLKSIQYSLYNMNDSVDILFSAWLLRYSYGEDCNFNATVIVMQLKPGAWENATFTPGTCGYLCPTRSDPTVCFLRQYICIPKLEGQIQPQDYESPQIE
jgi:hypothetical protein